MSNTREKKGSVDVSNNIFVYISNGELKSLCKAENADEKTRTKKVGDKTIYEDVWKHIQGKIVGIGLSERELKNNNKKIKQIEIKIKDSKGYVFLTIDFSSRYGSIFMKKLPNIDLSKEVLMYPSFFSGTKTQDGKDAYYFTIYQDFNIDVPKSGKKIEQYFTVENPKEMPLADENKNFKGEISKDYGRQEAFFENMIERIFKMNLLNEGKKDAKIVSFEKEIKAIAKELSSSVQTDKK